MNEQQRMRLVILVAAGVLCGSGLLAWQWYQTEKQNELQMNEPTLAPHVQLASQRPKLATTLAAAYMQSGKPAAGKSAQQAPAGGPGKPAAAQAASSVNTQAAATGAGQPAMLAKIPASNGKLAVPGQNAGLNWKALMPWQNAGLSGKAVVPAQTMLGPNGKPVVPAQMMLGPNGKPVVPAQMMLGPNGKPVVPAQMPGPNGKPVVPPMPGANGRPVVPAQMPGPNGKPVVPPMPGPNGRPVVPPMLGPNGKPVVPPMLGPNGKPVVPPMPGPNGKPVVPAPMLGPNGRPVVPPMLGPNGRPVVPAPMLGPNGRPVVPAPMLGPNGRPVVPARMLGPNGKPLMPPTGRTIKPPAVPPLAEAPDVPPSVSSTAPVSGVVVRATTLSEASRQSHENIGRTDPTRALTAFLPFPRATAKAVGDAGELVPPPDDASTKAGKNAAKDKGKDKLPAGELVPPPPPGSPSATDIGIDELPPPPDKPHIADNLKVLGIIDDQAIVAFPADICRKNNWPRTMTLATGQQFDSVKVVQVSPDGVTIEEDGERSLKPVPAIK